MPSVAPEATVQLPLQQSVPLAQTSPEAVQNEETAQTLPWQRFEQQSES